MRQFPQRPFPSGLLLRGSLWMHSLWASPAAALRAPSQQHMATAGRSAPPLAAGTVASRPVRPQPSSYAARVPAGPFLFQLLWSNALLFLPSAPPERTRSRSRLSSSGREPPWSSTSRLCSGLHWDVLTEANLQPQSFALKGQCKNIEGMKTENRVHLINPVT